MSICHKRGKLCSKSSWTCYLEFQYREHSPIVTENVILSNRSMKTEVFENDEKVVERR